VGDEFLKRVNWVGAKNVTVYWLKNGTFVDAHNAARWWSGKSGDTSERGFFFFGKREALKAAYMEAVDQIPKPIDFYFQGISSAMGVYSTYKASKQLLGMGLIPKIPGLVCIQEETCNPMVRGWERGVDKLSPEDIIRYPRGLSKSTLRGDPSMVFKYVHDAVKDSGGIMLTALQDEMRAMQKLARELEGIDMCHTATMTLVAAERLAKSGWLAKDAVIMLNITGADRRGEPHPVPDFVVEKDGEGWSVAPFEGGSTVGSLDRVLKVLVETAKLPPETELDTETYLMDRGLALDSVTMLELSLALEKEFGMNIPEQDLSAANFRTIGAIADYFRSRLSAAAQAKP
jgi:threonine synthase